MTSQSFFDELGIGEKFNPDLFMSRAQHLREHSQRLYYQLVKGTVDDLSWAATLRGETVYYVIHRPDMVCGCLAEATPLGWMGPLRWRCVACLRPYPYDDTPEAARARLSRNPWR